MRKGWQITQEAFDKLLLWLNEDRELAGARYEEIRRGLVKIFVYRACYDPESLADETINRVIEKLPLLADYDGEKSRYFFGVANMVHLEDLKESRKTINLPPKIVTLNIPQERKEFTCLDSCLDELSDDSRYLVTKYYVDEKRLKIMNRKSLADEIGIEVNALRIRASRIRGVLRTCVKSCLDSN